MVEFWLTPINRVFLVVGERVVFPVLQGASLIRFDDPRFTVSGAVEADLLRILRKQRDVRRGWVAQGEIMDDEGLYA